MLFRSQPSSNTSATRQNLSFTVVSTSVPSGATLQYFWQKYNGSSWANVANTAGQYFNNTSPTFTANNKAANGNVFRAIVSTANANSVTSGSATVIWYTP